jgi:hypothetical protein
MMHTSSKLSFAVIYRYAGKNQDVYKLMRFARLWNKPNFTKNELTTTMQSYNGKLKKINFKAGATNQGCVRLARSYALNRMFHHVESQRINRDR